ncbi:hypothetical protein EDC01DRAFT_759389 [Geopyxis carbonaria]|nr:hypothetical protein EDC01DRAFT_759389 [Geopyxis carbonaria]
MPRNVKIRKPVRTFNKAESVVGGLRVGSDVPCLVPQHLGAFMKELAHTAQVFSLRGNRRRSGTLRMLVSELNGILESMLRLSTTLSEKYPIDLSTGDYPDVPVGPLWIVARMSPEDSIVDGLVGCITSKGICPDFHCRHFQDRAVRVEWDPGIHAAPKHDTLQEVPQSICKDGLQTVQILLPLDDIGIGILVGILLDLAFLDPVLQSAASVGMRLQMCVPCLQRTMHQRSLGYQRWVVHDALRIFDKFKSVIGGRRVDPDVVCIVSQHLWPFQEHAHPAQVFNLRRHWRGRQEPMRLCLKQLNVPPKVIVARGRLSGTGVIQAMRLINHDPAEFGPEILFVPPMSSRRSHPSSWLLWWNEPAFLPPGFQRLHGCDDDPQMLGRCASRPREAQIILSMMLQHRVAWCIPSDRCGPFCNHLVRTDPTAGDPQTPGEERCVEHVGFNRVVYVVSRRKTKPHAAFAGATCFFHGVVVS